MTDVTALDERGLEEVLSEPTEATKEVVSGLNGDIVVLGAGGKMGPTMAMMLKKAAGQKTVYAISRFSDPQAQKRIEQSGVKTIKMDLLDESLYSQLPDVENVYYLAGMKFGATGNQPLTWALNSFLPGLVARHYKNSRIVAFSTGNVYPLVERDSGGAKEQTEPSPIGEYAQSCLGRERIFQYFSQINGTAITLIRLNYANEPRYGIIVDLATKIINDQPIDLTTGAVNLIWQRDANDYIIRAISLARSPATLLNVTGEDIVPVRKLAGMIGEALNKEPVFVSEESRTSLLSDASYCVEEFGSAQTSLEEMVAMVTGWVGANKKVLNKPTKYDIRDGKF